jgi:hypothetical protein
MLQMDNFLKLILTIPIIANFQASIKKLHIDL